MKRYITDNTGKQIEVTDINKAITQAETFSKYEDEAHHLTIYWKHLLNQLLELKKVMDTEPKPEPFKDNIDVNQIPLWVRKIREDRLKNHAGERQRLFVKNGTEMTSVNVTLHGIHNCVKARQNIYKLEKMEIGETWTRGWGSPSLTRIF